MPTTEAQSKLYCGADLHGNNVFLTLCDQQGKRIMERRVQANLKSVNRVLDPYWEQIQTVAAYPLTRTLDERETSLKGFRTPREVRNPQKARPIRSAA